MSPRHAWRAPCRPQMASRLSPQTDLPSCQPIQGDPAGPGRGTAGTSARRLARPMDIGDHLGCGRDRTAQKRFLEPEARNWAHRSTWEASWRAQASEIPDCNIVRAAYDLLELSGNSTA